MASKAMSGEPLDGSPAFYFKQLYNGAEGWTVLLVARKLGYREQKVSEILGRIPPGIDTINTKALERHLSSVPDLYALEGLSYTVQELKKSLSEVICLGKGIDEVASSIGMSRTTFNRKLDLIKHRLIESFEGYDDILKEKTGNKLLFHSAVNSEDVRRDVITTILHTDFRPPGPMPIFTDGEVGFLSHHIVTRTLAGRPLSVAQKSLVFQTSANEKGRKLIDLGPRQMEAVKK